MTTTAPPDEAVDTTAERPKRRTASLWGWVLVAVLVIAVALAASQLAATGPGARGALDPESRSDTGALALAELLRDQGVEVEVVRSRAAAAAALDEDSTLALTNPYTLSDEALADLLAPADRVVFLSTGTHLLSELAIGENASGSAAPRPAACAVPAFAEVGDIRPDRLFAPADGVTGCFADGDAAAVLVDDRDGHRAVVEGVKLFSNATLAEDGNAALGLALLGQTARVVWYVPSYEDTDIQGATPDTLGTLTPDWVTPAILLLLTAGLAVAVARGRRFGPLVAETLPVTVRASETMHGRARLTARAADAPHATEALREGTRRRLARRLGLAVHASADEVADAAADRLRIPRGTLQSLLAGPPPTDDAALVTLARRLDELETAVETSAQTPRSDA
ncbi:DUF4350 domain-containing protein [Microbacterium sp. LEMMJ01]|uniref:DUF4350 domain-containing protein n=1 Tax=Microbacterium sp. LEMMJ01 TaxID=1978350 RepID=UPI000A1DACAC|nr:DUF4350 domain-containing protein [Microbacterium sp. LEMMJ01]OSO98583.1 hypothetical protein B7W94_13680 [Microbacterium sp. LEMMJ01]